MNIKLLLVALLVAVGGCSSLVDPCVGHSGTCLALYVDSAPAAFDTVHLHLHADTPAVDLARQSTSPGLREFGTPVAIAVVLGDSVLASAGPTRFAIAVAGLAGSVVIGDGETTASVTRGQHSVAHVQLLGGGDLAVPGDLAGTAGDGGASAGDGMTPVVAAPRLVGPLSTSTVTQRQPTLRWALGAGAGTASVDLCQDRACTTPVPIAATVASDGLHAVPDKPLALGWVFWRVRVVLGATTATSATWQFWVGKASASTAVDTSNGTILDVNGDGYADFLIGAAGANANVGAAHLYLGSASGSLQRLDLVAPASSVYFGDSLASAGDVNGDGYADFLVGEGSGAVGDAHLYLGGMTPSASDWNGASPSKRIDLANLKGASSSFGSALASAGDVNGDGYADFLVSGDNGAGPVHLYLGGPTPSASAWSAAATGQRVDFVDPDLGGPPSGFGGCVAGAGDVNGDGFADFLIGAAGANYVGATHLYLGEATPIAYDWNGVSPSNRIDLAGIDGNASSFGAAVASAGDVNGDGYADFLIGASAANTNVGAAHVYLGAQSPSASSWNGASAVGRVDLASADGTSAHFGSSVASAGDINGDGYADFIMGAYGYGSGIGVVNVYLGEAIPSGADWNGAAPAKRIDEFNPYGGPGPTQADEFGFSVVGTGDVNGDGYADFLVGAPNAGSGSGIARLFLGEPNPNASDWSDDPPPKRIDVQDPDGASARFGISVGN